jgi:hypothetical protein
MALMAEQPFAHEVSTEVAQKVTIKFSAEFTFYTNELNLRN